MPRSHTILGPFLLAAITCCGGADEGNGPELPSCEVPEADLRRPISTENPAFIYNVYSDGPESIRNLGQNLPSDVRPYFMLHLVPAEPYDDSPGYRLQIETWLDEAEVQGLPALIQIEHGDTRNPTPRAYWDELFNRYSMMTGFVFAELCWSGLWYTALDDDYMERMQAAIQTTSAHGGLFIWQDMAIDEPWLEVPHVFLKAGANPDLLRTFADNAAHVVLMDKRNGGGKRFVATAAALGYWTSCQIGNWGVNAEDWLWFEAGFGPLFEPSAGSNDVHPALQSIFTYPDALYGMEWMIAAAGGATVFSLETPFHGFATTEADQFTPAFEQVVLPLIRLILEHHPIPGRRAVRERIQVAYHPGEPAPEHICFDELFAGLYGPSESSFYEWLPSTGRYFFLPILPVRAHPDILELFPQIVDSRTFERLYSDVAEKVRFFDELYPVAGSGDAWFVGFEDIWFLANPNENQDVTSTFEIPLSRHGNLAGSIAPHTFGVFFEEPDGLRAHLSNYRIDAQTDVWGNPDLESGDIAAYVRNTYISNPTDDQLRTTLLVIRGAFNTAPEITISGNNGFTHNETLETDGFKIHIEHNGPVDLFIEL